MERAIHAFKLGPFDQTAWLVAADFVEESGDEIAAAEQALAPVDGSPSPYFLLRLTGFLREAAARLAPRA